jgi:uncharacterized protein
MQPQHEGEERTMSGATRRPTHSPNGKDLWHTPLVKSQYLRILDRPDEGIAFLYHSLFGNLHLVDSKSIDLIDWFTKPAAANDIPGNPEDAEGNQNLIEEFCSLYYLVPEGFDERVLTERELSVRAASLDTGELINAVQLNVSEGCNLKCTYCFADRVDERATLYNIGARNDKKLMTLEIAIESINAVTELIRQHGNHAMVIKFFGREPLLNWKVIDSLIDYCGSLGDFQYHYAITTNGTLFTPEIVKKLKESNVTIVVSLDGLAEANLLRLTHSGQETFSSVDRGLTMLKKHGVSCCVASVLSDQNFDLLTDDFLKYLRSRSVTQWEVKLAMQNDGTMTHSASEYAHKLLHFYQQGKELGIAVTGDWYDPFATLFHTTKLATDDHVQRLAPNSCSATDHQISIEPGGGIFGCRALDAKLGSVDDLTALFQSSTYKHLSMRTYYNVPFCHGCKLEGLCQGVCLGHSERKFGSIYQPDNDYCNIYREVFDLLLKSYFENELPPASTGVPTEGSIDHIDEQRKQAPRRGYSTDD